VTAITGASVGDINDELITERNLTKQSRENVDRAISKIRHEYTGAKTGLSPVIEEANDNNRRSEIRGWGLKFGEPLE